ncbi:MAG: hypothetical protein IKT68_04895 [Clostridia bacterium]|nr:hypothetical protein [Clostridia bacterium]
MKKPVAEQVAELTPEQQEKMYRVGKIAWLIELLAAAPFVVVGVSLIFYGVFLSTGLYPDWDAVDQAMLFGGIASFIGVVIAVVCLVVVKVQCPYYSDSKWWYIRKMRKQK